MRALILAGGRGTRLRPLTDTRPKPLMPFMGAPFAAGLLERLRDAGCARATFLVGAHAEPFDALHTLGAALGLAVDVCTEEVALDTAGAVRRALDGTEPVLVCNGDILTDLDYGRLLAAHREADAAATIALTRVVDTSAFGVVVTAPDGQVRRFVEKPAPGTVDADTINAGTYVLEPRALRAFPGDGPLSFEQEVFPALLGTGLHAWSSEAYWADLGTPARYRAGHAAVLTGACRWPVPSAMRLSSEATAVHERARVEPSARLEAPAVVGDGAAVGDGAHLTDVVVLDGAVIGARVRASGVVIGVDASVGDDARLGDDTVVGDGGMVPAGADVPPGTRVGTGCTFG